MTSRWHGNEFEQMEIRAQQEQESKSGYIGVNLFSTKTGTLRNDGAFSREQDQSYVTRP